MNRTARVATIVATTLIGLTSLAACSSSEGSTASSKRSDSSAASSTAPSASSSVPTSAASSSAAASPSARAAVVTISDYTYSSVPSVAPGTKVTVTNKDAEAHTVTADGPGGFDVKVDPGASATFTAPTTPGSYSFHCAFHANMKGTLKVG